MNIHELHSVDKVVSVKKLFTGDIGTTTSIRILKNNQLKKHITKTPAFLICISGQVVFENENGISIKLSAGDYIFIDAMVNHWLNANEDSQLLLIK